MAGPSGQTDEYQLPFPIQDDTVDVPRDIKALAEKIDDIYDTTPPGVIMMWLTIDAPIGWYLMDGTTLVPASTNPKLAALLGVTGANVNIPDMSDRFPVGSGPTMALGSTAGGNSVKLLAANMPSHNHNGKTQLADRSLSHEHSFSGTMWAPTSGQFHANNSNPFTGNPGYNAVASWYQTPNPSENFGWKAAAAVAPNHQHVIDPQGSDVAHENRPLFRAVNFIIKGG